MPSPRPYPRRRSRFGLALAGGGPLGVIYEIGALAALSDTLRGIDFTDADVYVGVSAGGFIAAGLANGFTPHQMSRLFIEGVQADDRFDPEILLRPALAEYRARLRSLPPLVWRALRSYATRSNTLIGAFERLGRAIPTGMFSGDEIHAYLARVFAQPGRTNDFRELQHKLFLVATDLDTGESVNFGAPGFDHVPISRAVQASAALPGLFPPVEIDGRSFVDGALRKTLHASVALDQDIDLLLCLNPLVPYDASPQARARPRAYRLNRLVEGGLPVVLAQTFRSIIHSRLDTGMERYKSVYPHTDVVLFQPSRADADTFFTNMFSYGSRRALCEHAYQRTREELLARHRQLAPRLARHGIAIDRDALRDPALTLVRNTAPDAVDDGFMTQSARRLSHALDDLGRWLRAQPA
jgi:predicted acylesterase/phospholipase RssA